MDQVVLDSLPYIDEPASDAEIQAAQRLIDQEAKASKLHKPKELPIGKSYLSKETEKVVNDVGNGQKISAIELNKYGQLYDDNQNLIIDRALVSLEYSLSRQENLALLSQFGRNQWLIANDELDQEKAIIDAELARLTEQELELNMSRKRKQLEAQSTLQYLDSRWKTAIKGLVEVNAANLALESDLKRRRGE